MSAIQDQTELAFVRRRMIEAAPAPASSRGVVRWLRQNLLSGWLNVLATVAILYILYLIVTPVIDFVFVNGVWIGTDRAACATRLQGGIQPNGWFGGCWSYVGAYFNQFIYGRYPLDQRWRVDVAALLFVAGLAPLLVPSAPFKALNIVFMLLVFPVVALILLTGGHFSYDGFLLPRAVMTPSPLKFVVDYVVLTLALLAVGYALARGTGKDPRPVVVSILVMMAVAAVLLALTATDFGLTHVETAQWGGLLVTLVIAVTGIAASLPAGILLALGRRSTMPVVRGLSIMFIEFWRGVPLVTVLFMASVMLPLFLPNGVSFDKLLRALAGVGMFSAAYMAEVVRGGLQAVPKGQYEGAMALGLTYWQTMFKIVLPQALKIVIPGIVNTFIGLFKDTTLVLIIGLFDFLGQIQSSFSDPKWSSPVQVLTGYSFAALVYFVFCFGMGQYSRYMERRFDTARAR